ncbi:hypothetical protein L195_g062745, partial [Trifolium pratense]
TQVPAEATSQGCVSSALRRCHRNQLSSVVVVVGWLPCTIVDAIVLLIATLGTWAQGSMKYEKKLVKNHV